MYHIDDDAIAALTAYYKKKFTPNADVLDICSSWVSHFPDDVKLGRRVGLGMVLPSYDQYFHDMWVHKSFILL